MVMDDSVISDDMDPQEISIELQITNTIQKFRGENTTKEIICEVLSATSSFCRKEEGINIDILKCLSEYMIKMMEEKDWVTHPLNLKFIHSLIRKLHSWSAYASNKEEIIRVGFVPTLLELEKIRLWRCDCYPS